MNIAKQFLSGLVVVGMLCLPLMNARAQQNGKAPTPPPPLPCETCGGGGGGYVPTAPSVPSTVSTAVMNQTQSVATNMQVHLNSGKFLESDATALATALQLSFANWAETGFTAILQNWILANAPLYTTAIPTAQQLQAAYQQLVKLDRKSVV